MDSKIIVTQPSEELKSDLVKQIDSKLVKFYECDEFKIEHSKELIREAYIAEESTKYLIVFAKAYRIEAQNAILKLLEEPPRNIIIILVSPTKTAFLPTILSRMRIEYIKTQKEPIDLGLDIKKMELSDILSFLKSKKSIKKDELKQIVEELLKLSVKNKIALNSKELELFSKSLLLAELNSRSQTILSLLLLTIYHAKARR